MSITVDMYKEVRGRYLKGESKRKIAKDLGISRNTVKKYCDGANVPWERKKADRKSPVVTDEVIEFINKCFEEDEKENLKKQKHTARRIYERLVAEKGFQGGESTIRHKVSELKGRRVKAFIPLQFEPGEAMQVDWGEAAVYICEVRQKIFLFCARLCFSCKPFVLAFSHQNEESFLEAFVRIFDLLQGVPARIIFDNAKVAVKAGYGKKAEKQDRYSKLCAHYGFDADFCNPASGHEKGLVEGLVGWSRRNILVPVPHVDDLEGLNTLLIARCDDYKQKHILGKEDTVGAMFQKEEEYLRPLPSFHFETANCLNVRVNRFSTVRFQTNEYSVPAKYVGCQVGVKGYSETVEIYCKGKKISEHKRLFGKNKKSCRLLDYIDLLEERGRAVLNALPVKQNVSDEAYEELKANIGDPKKLLAILRREASLPPEPDPEGCSDEQILPDDDPVKIKKVDLKAYDTLIV